MIEHVRQPVARLLASGVLLTGILGFMVVDRMLLLRNGREIVLPIRPVDPRDLFKGDFARLAYDISRLDAGLASGLGGSERRDETVYVTLERDAGEVEAWKPVAVARTLPTALSPNQIAIRGRTNRYASNLINYGLESYYLPEGTGRRIEEMARKSQLSAIVAIDGRGRAAIKGLVIDGKRVYDEPLL
jgi:uncharacterized membrane-anchored protein